MAFLFGRTKTRSAQDLTKSTKELMGRLIAEDPKSSAKVMQALKNYEISTDRDAQIEEELARNLSQMKVLLQGTPGIR